VKTPLASSFPFPEKFVMARMWPTRLPLAILLLLGVAATAPADDKASPPEPEAKEVQLARIAISGGLPEAPTQSGLFGQLQKNLRDTLQRLEKAAGDDSISGVVLELDGARLGRARIGEVRAAIARTRAAGKTVYARLDSGEAADYLLASACDEIVMPPSATLTLPGVRMEITFYKGLLDKLGVEADFLHIGAYKGAAEPLTRKSLSPEVRRNLTAIVDDYYDQMVHTIAADRDLEPKRVKELIDQGLFTARQAEEAGLIDRVAYRDQLQTTLRDHLKAEEVKVVADYGEKKVEEDFSGTMGMFKLLGALLGGSNDEKKSDGKKIAVVYAVGAITTGESETGMFGSKTLGADTLIAALKKADESDNVAAIVLRVDSPGGSALASDLIWREVERIDKPIIASMGDTAASGGYYISMGADKIYAGEGTLTGSIGVVGGKLVLGGLLDKLGVATEVISRGKNSGMFASTDRFTDAERKAMRGMMEETYEQFTTKAAQGRHMELDQLKKLAGGQVWTGRMAKQNGLIDEIGTLKDALAAAKKAAGIEPDEKIEIVELPKPTSFLESLLGGDDDVSLSLKLDTPLARLRPHLQQAAALRAVFRDKIAVVLPFRVRVK
jgi:protease-4